MKFLVDESTGRKLHLALLNEKHDSVFVGDLFPGALDKEVLHHAEKEKRIPITNDHDFG
ncbi:DUF5615 family PIN-like protein, partial [Candidatus Woesearchaeota archaeon]|nr:DUF5615 family PIN-like protein [Candidatus Woesearchaeota archaeon]